MISRARLKANRQNAKRSTGPRSAAGKQRSSKNAIKHGITAEKHFNKIEFEHRKEAIQSFLDTLTSDEAENLAHEIAITHQALNNAHMAWDDELSGLMTISLRRPKSQSPLKKLKLISLYGRRASNRQLRAIRRYEELKKAEDATVRGKFAECSGSELKGSEKGSE